MLKARKTSDYKIGLICVIGCQVMWGILPIYWQALMPIDSVTIILYRILTMFIYAFIGARFRYSTREILAPLKDRKVRIRYFTAGLLLTANWSIYIWAINSGRVIQTTIGYYIEPLVICIFGIVLFHEKITKYNATAMILALIALIVILCHLGKLPGIALGLALTWAIYSAIKKTADQPILISLVFETMPYAVIALIAIVYLEVNGIGGLSYHVPVKYGMLFLTGLVTVVPVALFGVSAKKVSLFIIGLAQYIGPTLTLLCGIFLFKEGIDKIEIIAFCIIWLGLVFFTIGEFKSHSGSNASEENA